MDRGSSVYVLTPLSSLSSFRLYSPAVVFANFVDERKYATFSGDSGIDNVTTGTKCERAERAGRGELYGSDQWAGTSFCGMAVGFGTERAGAADRQRAGKSNGAGGGHLYRDDHDHGNDRDTATDDGCGSNTGGGYAAAGDYPVPYVVDVSIHDRVAGDG